MPRPKSYQRFTMYDFDTGLYNGLDKATAALLTIDYAHHEIHSGSMFSACDTVDLADSAVRDILIVTPNTTKWAHMLFNISSELEADAKFYEATTASDNGTALNAYNRNRNATSKAATTLAFHTPTVAGGSEGTLICQKHWGKADAPGPGSSGGGGNAREDEEWVLKQNTKYLLRITNATSSANQVWTELHWYEHTDKIDQGF